MSKALRKLREYETLVVTRADVAEDQIKATLDRCKEILTAQKADILSEDRWGKRKLSFEVKEQTRGDFTILHYIAPTDVVEELERNLRNMDAVIRFLTTLNGDVADIETKKAEIEKTRREREERRAKIRAEEAARAEAREQRNAERGDRDRGDRGDRGEREQRAS